MDLFRDIELEQRQSIDWHPPELPRLEGVNEVIQKATAKNPKHRFQDASAMAAAFALVKEQV